MKDSLLFKLTATGCYSASFQRAEVSCGICVDACPNSAVSLIENKK